MKVPGLSLKITVSGGCSLLVTVNGLLIAGSSLVAERGSRSQASGLWPTG